MSKVEDVTKIRDTAEERIESVQERVEVVNEDDFPIRLIYFYIY
jgi:hypothetical protein